MINILDDEILIADQYISKEILGKGHYGKVYLAKDINIKNNKNQKDAHKKFAIKVLKKRINIFKIKLILLRDFVIVYMLQKC